MPNSLPPSSGPITLKSNLFAQMCYHGQNFDMSVALPEGDAINESHLLDLADRFHRLHEASRGFSFPNQQPLVRGIRLVQRGLTPKPPLLAQLGTTTDPNELHTGSRPAYFGDGFIDTPTYDGASMGPGTTLTGPALIEEPFTVVVLAAGDQATLDENGNYSIQIDR